MWPKRGSNSHHIIGRQRPWPEVISRRVKVSNNWQTASRRSQIGPSQSFYVIFCKCQHNEQPDNSVWIWTVVCKQKVLVWDVVDIVCKHHVACCIWNVSLRISRASINYQANIKLAAARFHTLFRKKYSYPLGKSWCGCFVRKYSDLTDSTGWWWLMLNFWCEP